MQSQEAWAVVLGPDYLSGRLSCPWENRGCLVRALSGWQNHQKALQSLVLRDLSCDMKFFTPNSFQNKTDLRVWHLPARGRSGFCFLSQRMRKLPPPVAPGLLFPGPDLTLGSRPAINAVGLTPCGLWFIQSANPGWPLAVRQAPGT